MNQVRDSLEYSISLYALGYRTIFDTIHKRQEKEGFKPDDLSLWKFIKASVWALIFWSATYFLFFGFKAPFQKTANTEVSIEKERSPVWSDIITDTIAVSWQESNIINLRSEDSFYYESIDSKNFMVYIGYPDGNGSWHLVKANARPYISQGNKYRFKSYAGIKTKVLATVWKK